MTTPDLTAVLMKQKQTEEIVSGVIHWLPVAGVWGNPGKTLSKTLTGK